MFRVKDPIDQADKGDSLDCLTCATPVYLFSVLLLIILGTVIYHIDTILLGCKTIGYCQSR